MGIHFSDSEKDLDWLVKKIVGLRIFSDENEKMNLSISDVDGEILIISQFTLFASTKKGNRPSFLLAAKPEKAIPLYQLFIDKMEKETSKKIATGIFGADMFVHKLHTFFNVKCGNFIKRQQYFIKPSKIKELREVNIRLLTSVEKYRKNLVILEVVLVSFFKGLRSILKFGQ